MLNNYEPTKILSQPTPIGIFDSGMGGLTMASTLQKLMPEQTLVYIADTAHCPWGDKSITQIINYSNKLTSFLVEHHCKIVVIACNTASCVAFSQLQQNFANTTIINVIDPTIEYLSRLNLDKCKDIGIIGTKQTINSAAYQLRIKNVGRKSGVKKLEQRIKAIATPLLVPLIEEGLTTHPATKLILHEYLSRLNLTDNSMLILGCTHYPLIKNEILNYYNALQQQITIVDPTVLTANIIKNIVNQENATINSTKTLVDKFFFTEDNNFFISTAQRLFPDLNLQYLSLWE